ncbi:MAG TPA: DASS family sodium-coupled anion symporter [Nitrospirota bacterium]|nr:DASS family sodium-coupled anion symporter [Nitrospirota bacterium]
MPRWVKLLIIVGVGVGLYNVPAPQGLTAETWHVFAIYIASMVCLVLKPFPEAIVFLSAVALCSILFNHSEHFLEGYTEGVPWLIFSAFMIGAAFVKTGLGTRIAYYLIRFIGRTTLGLGYVVAFTDMLLAFVTPSNTARTGGIVLPIIQSVAKTLHSEPGPTARRIGAYLVLLAYQVSLTTGYIVITGVAPNLLIAKFANDILHVQLYWGNWFAAAVIPGMTMLLFMPYLVYKLYPPELKEIDNKKLAADGLRELGPMSGKEKILIVLFFLAVLGWTTGNITNIQTQAVALGVMSLIMLTGILSWEEMIKQHAAWHTLIWFGGILGIMSVLVKGKFFLWAAATLKANLNFGGLDPMVILFIITVISLAVRYFFASGSAYVASMIPVFYTVGLVAGVPPMPLALVLAFSHVYGCLLTHYGSGAGIVLYGSGFVPQWTFWKIGTVVVVISTILTFSVIPLWKWMGLW